MERIIISSCLNNPENIIECESEGLLPKHFGIYANQVIYMGIAYLFGKNMAVDPLAVYNAIKDDKAKKAVDDLGGLEYLMLLQQSPQTQNIKIFIEGVMQAYIRRCILATCEVIKEDMIKNEKDDIDTILGEINQKMNDITLEFVKENETYKMGDKLSERIQNIMEHPSELPGLSVGWKKFDKVTKGAKSGDLIVVCAESKTGKSVTLLNWAKFIAIDSGLPILWIDTEQDDKEQEMRLLSCVSQIPQDEIEYGLFMEDTAYGKAVDKIRKIKWATNLINSSQFHFVYMPDFTTEKISALTRKFHLKYGIVALFFDYLKLNTVISAKNNNLRSDEKLTFVTSALKELGGMLKIPVFTANNENRTNWGSTEKDARSVGGSLGILQLATKLCFLRNKTEEELAREPGKGNQKFHIAYQRHGQCPIDLDIHFDKIRISQYEIED